MLLELIIQTGICSLSCYVNYAFDFGDIGSVFFVGCNLILSIFSCMMSRFFFKVWICIFSRLKFTKHLILKNWAIGNITKFVCHIKKQPSKLGLIRIVEMQKKYYFESLISIGLNARAEIHQALLKSWPWVFFYFSYSLSSLLRELGSLC